jgi:hypothetical protein
MHDNHLSRLTSLLALTLFACVPVAPAAAPTPFNAPTSAPPATHPLNPSTAPTANMTASQKPRALVPEFEYIVTVVFENREYGTVVNNRQMPYFNELAKSYTLLTQHYAVTHPSLPNYLALLSGQTFDLTFDCTTCVYDAPSLPDLIEASGRTWKAYEEEMPSSCFLGAEAGRYEMKHNPFVYFKSIRLDSVRCKRSVVPMGQLYTDLATGNLPNYSFITPNMCNDAHDCGLGIADDWLKALMLALLPALDAQAKPYLLVITWDEGQGSHSCCGLPPAAGGRVATILVSPQAKGGFKDTTPYTHYSILKTIAESWRLSYLGHAADSANALIIAPWK